MTTTYNPSSRDDRAAWWERHAGGETPESQVAEARARGISLAEMAEEIVDLLITAETVESGERDDALTMVEACLRHAS